MLGLTVPPTLLARADGKSTRVTHVGPRVATPPTPFREAQLSRYDAASWDWRGHEAARIHRRAWWSSGMAAYIKRSAIPPRPASRRPRIWGVADRRFRVDPRIETDRLRRGSRY